MPMPRATMHLVGRARLGGVSADRHQHERGAALLLVLWLITLLTALVGSFALAARIENIQAHVLSRGLVARNAARAGVEYALLRVNLDNPHLRWSPDGQPHQWQYAGAQVEIEITDESGKVDLNQADITLLAGLLRAAHNDSVSAGRPLAGGVDEPAATGGRTAGVGAQPLGQRQARQLAAAIIDWRDPDPLTQPVGGAEDPDYASAGRAYGAKDAAFQGVAELQQVLGFTPALYDAIVPYVTVHSGRARPDPAFAGPVVLAAMGVQGSALAGQRGLTGEPPPWVGVGQVRAGSGTYSIDSRARLADGRESRLRVVVRMGGGMPGDAYTALRWQEGATSR